MFSVCLFLGNKPTNLALFSLYLVTGYLCLYSFGQRLSWLHWAVSNITLINLMKFLICCKVCNFIFLPAICIAFANMVRCGGHQAIRKGSLPLLAVRRASINCQELGLGTSFSSTVLQQWTFLWCETFCFLVPLPTSETHKIDIPGTGPLRVAVQCFKVSEARMTFRLIFTPAWGAQHLSDDLSESHWG